MSDTSSSRYKSIRFSKRSGTALCEMCFDLGIIEIGPVSSLTYLLTKPAIVSLAVAHELQRKHPFIGRARQQDPHGVGYRETHVSRTAVAFSFTSASMRVWTKAFEAIATSLFVSRCNI